MASWYYEHSDAEFGPVPPAEMRQRVADGTITAATRVRREDGSWTTASQVPGLLSDALAYALKPEGDSTGGLIPYKNPSALIAYYLGLLSLIPCVGLPVGIAALVLGIIGLKNRNANPAIKGSVHAWIGIVLGGVMSIIWLLASMAAIIGATVR